MSLKSDEALFTVSRINQAIGGALAEAFPDPFWVVGEIQGYERDAARAGQRRWGQVYFELVEKEPGADAARASVAAHIRRPRSVKAGARALYFAFQGRMSTHPAYPTGTHIRSVIL